MMEKEWLVGNLHLSAEAISPIEGRVSRPDLLAGLVHLKELLGTERYAKYIVPLQSIARNEESMLIRTANVMARSLLERECLPAIKEAFGVKVVRIIG